MCLAYSTRRNPRQAKHLRHATKFHAGFLRLRHGICCITMCSYVSLTIDVTRFARLDYECRNVDWDNLIPSPNKGSQQQLRQAAATILIGKNPRGNTMKRFTAACLDTAAGDA